MKDYSDTCYVLNAKKTNDYSYYDDEKYPD